MIILRLYSKLNAKEVIKMYLGELINSYRKQNKITLQEFADKCELSKGYIAMLEKNYNPKTKTKIIPSLSTFAKVSRAMGLTLDELMAKVDEDQPVDIQEFNSLSSEEMALKAQRDELLKRLNEVNYNDDEKAIVKAYRQLSDVHKATIKEMIEFYLRK